MRTLEDRLDQASTELRRGVASMPTRPPSELSRRLSQRRTLSVTTVLVLVLGSFAGTALLLTGESGRPVASGASTADRFPIPEYLPDGVELVYASFALPDPNNPPSINAVVARTSTDAFEEAVLVNVIDWPDAPPYPAGESTVINGYDAHLIRNDGKGGGVTLWWEQGDIAVWVHATSGDPSLARSVATAVRVATPTTGDFADTAITFSGLPAGYSVVAPPAVASSQPRPVVALEGPRGPQGPEPDHLAIEVFTEPMEHAIAGVRSGTTTEIRGRSAYRFENDDQIGFVWEEAPGVTVVINGSYTEPEIRATAESLKFVTEAEWRNEYEIAGSAFDLPTTTIPSDDLPSTAPSVATDREGSNAPTTTAPD